MNLYDKLVRTEERRYGLRAVPRPFRAPPKKESASQAAGRRSMRSHYNFMRCKNCGSDWPPRVFATGKCPTCVAIATAS